MQKLRLDVDCANQFQNGLSAQETLWAGLEAKAVTLNRADKAAAVFLRFQNESGYAKLP